MESEQYRAGYPHAGRAYRQSKPLRQLSESLLLDLGLPVGMLYTASKSCRQANVRYFDAAYCILHSLLMGASLLSFVCVFFYPFITEEGFLFHFFLGFLYRGGKDGVVPIFYPPSGGIAYLWTLSILRERVAS